MRAIDLQASPKRLYDIFTPLGLEERNKVFKIAWLLISGILGMHWEKSETQEFDFCFIL